VYISGTLCIGDFFLTFVISLKNEKKGADCFMRLYINSLYNSYLARSTDCQIRTFINQWIARSINQLIHRSTSLALSHITHKDNGLRDQTDNTFSRFFSRFLSILFINANYGQKFKSKWRDTDK